MRIRSSDRVELSPETHLERRTCFRVCQLQDWFAHHRIRDCHCQVIELTEAGEVCFQRWLVDDIHTNTADHIAETIERAVQFICRTRRDAYPRACCHRSLGGGK